MMLASPIVSGDTLIAACINGNILAIDWRKGELIWNYSSGSSAYSTPAIDNDMVYTAFRDGSVRALDRQTGSLLWRFDVEDTIASEKEIQAPIKMTSSRIYVGCFNGKLYCLNKNGTKAWDYQTHFYIKEAAAISDTLIAISSRDEAIYLLRNYGDSVVLLWKNRVVEYGEYVPGSVARTSPVIVNGYVFTNSAEAECGHFTRALSVDSGKKAASFPDNSNFNTTGFAVGINEEVVSNIWGYNPLTLGKLFGVSGSYMRFLRSNSAPVITANQFIFHSSYHPKGIFFVNPETKTVRQDTLKMENYTVSTSFAVSNNVLFFGTYEKVLFGIGKGSGNVGAENIGSVFGGKIEVSPNPFNPSTNIRFALLKGGNVELSVFNVSGRCIWKTSGIYTKGYHSIKYTTDNHSAGVYMLRLSCKENTRNIKLVIAK
ncbi:MAG: PQQ-binding-like beta-propeller repeat protein [Fibrobacteres bacterium]|nr:PQQ-binding-like beta-propeller repeat protein [Fibrobacterota bacterium]